MKIKFTESSVRLQLWTAWTVASIALCAALAGADRASAGPVNLPTVNIPRVNVQTNIPRVNVQTNIPRVNVQTNIPRVNVQTNIPRVNVLTAHVAKVNVPK